MISIGAVVGGPECAAFDACLSRFMTYCEQHRADGTDTAEVNIVYHLPGSIWKPDYAGLRKAKFSRSEKTQMIQVSVENEWIVSSNTSAILQYIYDVADEAIGIAKGELMRRGIEYDVDADRRLLDAWKGSVS
jgi:hypothetical protein